MRLSIKNILSKNGLVILLIFLAFIIRFYKLEEFVTFLGDQGRDAIIIKRIITFEHFPAIGPTSSIGGVFLGPFYYYLMAPFLALFRLNPAGLAYGSAILSLIGLAAAYYVVKKEINGKVALTFLCLMTFSSILIESARFSWNPNLLPFFSFFTLYFFYKFVANKKIFYAALFGSFLSFSLQLHYLIILLFFPIAIYSIIFLVQKKLTKSHLVGFLVALAAFILFTSPLIIFDLKHDFLNSKSFLKLLTDQKVVGYSSPLDKLLGTNGALWNVILNIQLPVIITLFFSILLLILAVKKGLFKPNFLGLHLLNFFTYILSFSLLNSLRLPHYYMQIYLSFFLITAFLMADFNKKKLLGFFTGVFLIIYILLNAQKYPFWHKEGNRQIWRAEMIAKSIIDRNPLLPYQIVPIPFTEMDGHIRYFLEILGKTPLSEESSEQPKELYVLCYEKDCSVLNHPQWQIAAFKNKKVDKVWKIDRVKIYKLVHGK